MAAALAGLAVTCIAGFGKIIRQLSRMELKLEILWEHHVAETGRPRIGGRRFYDPHTESADDAGGDATG